MVCCFSAVLFLCLFLRGTAARYLQGIRIIKLFAWEKDFMSKIDKSRGKEMRSLRSYMVSEPVGLCVANP